MVMVMVMGVRSGSALEVLMGVFATGNCWRAQSSE